jgi:hemerythrin
MADADAQTQTGFKGMEGEHRVQIGLMTAFREAIGGGRGAAEADEILDHLLDYSKMHFMSEQLLMRLYEYGDYESHMADHDRMLQEMETVRARYRSGEDPFDKEAVDTLITGLIAHINRTDGPLGEYLGTLDLEVG